jgi:hypothetical protein
MGPPREHGGMHPSPDFRRGRAPFERVYRHRARVHRRCPDFRRGRAPFEPRAARRCRLRPNCPDFRRGRAPFEPVLLSENDFAHLEHALRAVANWSCRWGYYRAPLARANSKSSLFSGLRAPPGDWAPPDHSRRSFGCGIVLQLVPAVVRVLVPRCENAARRAVLAIVPQLSGFIPFAEVPADVAEQRAFGRLQNLAGRPKHRFHFCPQVVRSD